MRCLLWLFVLLLGACTVAVPTKPDNYDIAPKATAHLRSPQSVSLVNGYDAESNVQFRLRGGGTLVFERRQLTQTAIAMLTRALEKQGISVTPQAPKTITLQVQPQGLVFQYFRYTGRITLVARLGDAGEVHIPQENLSPMGWTNAFDGAVLFALNDLLEHENFVAYMK
jgi:hypothetical protein